ncbi:MAG: hypothetical protein U0790_03230 [Isosphaeraceae bacterium]
MPRRSSRSLPAIFTALYGVVLVLGPALHSLPGAEHARLGSHATGEAAEYPTPHEDCPVCHFLALAQIAGDCFLTPSLDVVHIQPVDDPPLTFPPPVDRLSVPRAPPLG